MQGQGDIYLSLLYLLTEISIELLAIFCMIVKLFNAAN